ncbi:DUF998 domain-containing protein [Mycolicibacterium sp. P1-18]|uniref:DUF998 domain-containing protein n=1 Tax=Mycolicibacterium sp. P1-18 TaxID=2024615 RepID=UPI0011F0F575|nr:DUF998 domain-containing protein [Mycolicibacterium sp. P1-18]KAA0102360.1 DUF998 domain-containing protein [Mycolicibacterium sp. P1-18]
MTGRIAAACWTLGGAVYLAFEAIAAAAFPGYRYDTNFISDLGRPDSPLSPLMNTAFAVQGTLFLAAAVALTRTRRGPGSRVFVACAAANAVGNVGVAMVPSGGAGIAWVHVTAATVAIVGGNAAILAGYRLVSESRWYRTASVGIAAVGFLAFALLAVGAVTASTTVVLPGAVWERTCVYTIIGWQLLAALRLLRR